MCPNFRKNLVMASGNLYDEFGNYIGPTFSDSGSSSSEDYAHEEEDTAMHTQQVRGEREMSSSEHIVLFEEKKYYASASDVYKGAETLYQDEDTQPITQPILTPPKTITADLVEKDLPDMTFSFEFLATLMEKPELMRNVCIAGSFHSGKTSFVDELISATRLHELAESRYLDSRRDERDREMSIKASPISLVLPNSNGKSYLFNIVDSPGHSNFQDEFAAAVRLCDSCVIVVDCLYGCDDNLKRLMRYAITEGLNIVLVLSKLDRLILELRLPPADAFYKLRHVLDEVNTAIAEICRVLNLEPFLCSPVKGNVLFSSASLGFCFSLPSFCDVHADIYGERINQLVNCLWGDVFWDADDRKFKSSSDGGMLPRGFVAFVLEPIYKLCAFLAGEESGGGIVEALGLDLRKRDFQLPTMKLLRKAFKQLFPNSASSLVDCLLNTASPARSQKLSSTHFGGGDSLLVQCVKSVHLPEAPGQFAQLARVLRGSLRSGSRVRVLGESYSTAEPEESAVKTVGNIWVSQGRFRVEVSHASVGALILISGLDDIVKKTATLIAEDDHQSEICKPLRFISTACIKVAVEPLVPAELPKMVQALRLVERAYPAAVTKVEESGEHVILGTGELYLDCLLRDLREVYGDIEVRVSDPSVVFTETCTDTSSHKCVATGNKVEVSVIAEPLEKGLAEIIELGMPKDQPSQRELLESMFGWDALASRSVWAFSGSSVLLNDTLPDEVDRQTLRATKDAIVQGFQWAVREGPLLEEAIRGSRFKLLDVNVAVGFGSGAVIPVSRRVCFQALLSARPRLMEPVMFTEVECPADCVAAVYTILSRRRGQVLRDFAKPGTPLFAVHAYIPAIDWFGFETDIRTHTHGMAFAQSQFDHWDVVPGDPLERVEIKPLTASPAPFLARDFLLKTRRRKGLSEDVQVEKFLD